MASRIGPAHQRAALLHHQGRVQQRGAHQPGHERGVLHRVPEPPAAPAQLVVGPEASPCVMPTVSEHQAASAQGRTQRAQAASTRPSISAATAKAEGHREADIAQVEERRMEREAGVLQQRIEALALAAAPGQAQERVGGEQDEAAGSRRRSAPAPPAPAPAASRGRLPPKAPPRRRTAPGSAPTAASSPRGCPRRRRSCRAAASVWRVLRRRCDREVGVDVGVHQRRERERDQQRTAQRRRRGDRHQRRSRLAAPHSGTVA